MYVFEQEYLFYWIHFSKPIYLTNVQKHWRPNRSVYFQSVIYNPDTYSVAGMFRFAGQTNMKPRCVTEH